MLMKKLRIIGLSRRRQSIFEYAVRQIVNDASSYIHRSVGHLLSFGRYSGRCLSTSAISLAPIGKMNFYYALSRAVTTTERRVPSSTLSAGEGGDERRAKYRRFEIPFREMFVIHVR